MPGDASRDAPTDVPAELARVRHAVDAALAALPDASVGSPVAVAVSGGPDSLALAAAATWSCRRRGQHVVAVIVDHGLQPQSASIAARARRQCQAFGADDVVVERVHVGTDGGPEAAARTARYAALERIAYLYGARVVLLGHTRDDQAETVLLRLAQGSGARALAGMRAVNGRWVRPLLDLPRADVRTAAAQALALGEGLDDTDRDAWADPHNADERFARVRVRALMPAMRDALGKSIDAGLARTAAQLGDDADALDALADALVAAEVTVETSDVASDGASAATLVVTADTGWLDGLLRALRTRVLRRMCVRAGCDERDLTWDHVVAVERLVTDWSGQGAVSLPGGVSAGRAYGRLRVTRTPTTARAIT